MARVLSKGRIPAVPDEVAKALAILQESIRGTATDTVPAGWRTSEQWAAAWAMSIPQARHYLRAGEKLGKVDAKKFCVSVGAFVRPVPHYFVKVS